MSENFYQNDGQFLFDMQRPDEWQGKKIADMSADELRKALKISITCMSGIARENINRNRMRAALEQEG